MSEITNKAIGVARKYDQWRRGEIRLHDVDRAFDELDEAIDSLSGYTTEHQARALDRIAGNIKATRLPVEPTNCDAEHLDLTEGGGS